MPNFLPSISEEDKMILQNFAKGATQEATTLKRVLQIYLEHFRDIRHVDPTDHNVVLQVCSHLRAYDMLEEIFASVDLCERPHEEKKSKSFR